VTRLDVICAGLGRTGTSSLKLALETIGYGPCYHMQTVHQHPEHAALWRRAMQGEPDWPAIFGDCRAVADEPAAMFWKTLADTWPNSRVIMNTRPAGDWYDSVLGTVYAAIQRRHNDTDAGFEVLSLANDLVFDGLFEGDFLDREKAIRIFEARTREVIDTVDPERLLAYSVSEGWDPLCEFLGVPVPATPFPRANTRAEFREKAGMDIAR